jgi:hypothetical protein
VSVRVKYDPSQFVLERSTAVSARLGELILGESKLGSTATTWTPVPAATLSISSSYSVNDAGVLILDSDTARVTLSFWDAPGDVLYPYDRVRATYAGKTVFLGKVDSTDLSIETDPDAQLFGASRRVDFAASIVGVYGSALAKTVYWRALPAETAITRLRRWITLDASGVADMHMKEAVADPGSATLLDLLRNFSTETGLPVRLTGPRSAKVVTFTGLPTGWAAGDADGVYHSTQRNVAAGASEFSLQTGDLALTVSADFVADDVRLILSDWALPGELPVYGLPSAPAKSIAMTFSPTGFTASVEFAFSNTPSTVRRP